MKRLIKVLSICFLIIFIFIGYNKISKNLYEKYSNSFFDVFDTMTVVVGYAKSEEEFDSYMEKMAEGFKSGIISAGGNVRVLDKPFDGVRKRWGIGIQDPSKSIFSDKDKNIDTIFLNNASVVSSGDYQRYYVVDDKKIHHLIDPVTLMPGEHYHAVTVVAKDSGLADILSTAVYLMPYKQSRKFVESLEGVEAVWVMPNGKIEATEGMKKIMKSNGASGAKSSL